MSGSGIDLMREDIRRQPSILAEALPELRARAASIGLDGERVFAGGCGDSWFAAEAMAAAFRTIDYRPASAMTLSAYQPLGPHDTVILISISGGTLHTVRAAEAARRQGARAVAVTCNGQSPLAAAADETLVLPYAPLSRATPHTLDYTMTLAALAVLAERASGHYIAALDDLPKALAHTLEVAEPALDDALEIVRPETRWFFLGAGPSLGTARYAAAKLHEAGGLDARAEEIENFVHGANFMLQPADAVCLFCDDAAALSRATSLRGGLRALVDTVILAGEGVPGGGPVAGMDGGALSTDAAMKTRTATFGRDPVQRPFVAAAVAQLLALHLAERLALSVDRPWAARTHGERLRDLQKQWMGDLG